jgi:hypothetical protein
LAAAAWVATHISLFCFRQTADGRMKIDTA